MSNDANKKTEAETKREAWEEQTTLKCEQAKEKFIGLFNKGERPDVHPLADSFPYMGDEEIRSIADSIRADGLRNPIVIDMDGNLIDGRNRLMALLELDCKIRDGYMAETPNGNYPLVNMKATMGEDLSVVRVIRPEFMYKSKYQEQIKRFILSENMDRRHLTTSQKAALGAYVSEDKSALSKKDVAERFAIGATILREAIRIREADLDVFDLVMQGELTVSEAMKALKTKEDEAKKEQESQELPDPSPTEGMEGEKPEQDEAPDSNPEQNPEQESEPEKTAPKEQPKMSKEERLKNLRWERDVFDLEESYMKAVIKLLQDSIEQINTATRAGYSGSNLDDEGYEEIRFRTEQTIFKKMFDVKDNCSLDKTRIDKVIGETLHKDAM